MRTILEEPPIEHKVTWLQILSQTSSIDEWVNCTSNPSTCNRSVSTWFYRASKSWHQNEFKVQSWSQSNWTEWNLTLQNKITQPNVRIKYGESKLVQWKIGQSCTWMKTYLYMMMHASNLQRDPMPMIYSPTRTETSLAVIMMITHI